ncbi:MAG: AMP-binding protein, partial [Planctomycetota bacterium]|nr:AMP-binding protein [Planctomycetota bacterium]
TSRQLVERLSQRGSDFSGIADRLVYLEDVRGRITLGQKLSAALTARFAPRSLAPKSIPDTIAILFTSGSESLPKAVPLTSGNVLTNLRDVLKRIELRKTDRLIGFLPPFHSFGLSTGMLVPLCMNLPVIHHTDPTQGPMLARLIEAYKVTVVLGTPTFLAGILRAATPGQLASLRLAVTGAEKCPPAVYAAFSAACPGARVVEGYGITECSPIVSFSDYDTPQPGTIGKPLPSIEYALVHPETNQRVGPGVPGVLLVRGPSIFPGYLGEAPSPFVEFEGKNWYRTGDLVTSDPAGCLTFAGRLKRFVKLGGEMISLPAIESVLFTVHARSIDPDKGPILAVEATATDPPELVLFSTLPLSRADVNDALRSAGLSGLHGIRRVINLEAIPVLGTGKTDYRALKELLKQAASNGAGA